MEWGLCSFGCRRIALQQLRRTRSAGTLCSCHLLLPFLSTILYSSTPSSFLCGLTLYSLLILLRCLRFGVVLHLINRQYRLSSDTFCARDRVSWRLLLSFGSLYFISPASIIFRTHPLLLTFVTAIRT